MTTTARTEVLSAYDQGRQAGTDGHSIIECPFDPAINPMLTRAWLRGHRDTALVDIPDVGDIDATDRAMFPEDYTTAVQNSTTPDAPPEASPADDAAPTDAPVS